MIKILPLSKKYLDEAISLVKTIFPYKEDQKIARINLEESLTLKKFGQRYWVVAGNSGKLAGVTGLYLDAKDRDVIWLGWFGVHPAYRRCGIGSYLLEFTIKEAKRKDFKKIKIYTSTDKHERAAHRLYELYGFKKIDYYKNIIPSFFENKTGEEIHLKEKRKKRNWFLRPTGIFIIVLLAGVIIISYLSPELEDYIAISVVIMLLRSIVITVVWYFLLAPIATKLFQKFIAKRKSEYSKDLEIIISMFPKFKAIVNYCWKLSGDKKGYKRIRYFLSTSFYYLLLSK